MEYDVIVIGGGPGGYVAALYAAANGLKTALVERDKLGGTCLNRGCIPTKTLIHSAHLYQQILEAKDFGIQVADVQYNWQDIQKRKDKVIEKLCRGVEGLLKARKVDILAGSGAVTDLNHVLVERIDGSNETIAAKNIILACGSSASRIPVPGAELEHVLVSDGALELSEVPRRLTIVGGGVIGLEMAYVFRSFGAQVTILELLPDLLPRMDQSLSAEVKNIITRLGICLETGVTVKGFVQTADGLLTEYQTSSGVAQTVRSDRVLLAAGRRPSLPVKQSVQLEKTERGFIKVNECMQTSVSNIYAIGDLNGRCMLAHAASYQGILAVSDILGKAQNLTGAAIPSCIYLSPNVASVGLTEQAAREQHGDRIKVGIFPLSASGMAAVCGEQTGFVKVISDTKWGEIQGIHIVAPNACELIAEAAALISCEATVEHLMQIVHPHPSISESLMEAAFMLNGTPLHMP